MTPTRLGSSAPVSFDCSSRAIQMGPPEGDPTEGLHGATGRDVLLSPRAEAHESLAESIHDARRPVADNREAGATFGTLGSKRRHDHQSVRRERRSQQAPVTLSLLPLHE